mgnify:CR=1 FL=1
MGRDHLVTLRRIAATLALVSALVGCQGEGLPPLRTDPLPTASAAVASPSPGPTASDVHILQAVTIERDIGYVGAVAVSPKWIAWTGLRRGDPKVVPNDLVLYDRTTGQSRVIARAREPAGIMAWLRINDEWAVWAEYTDRLQISDWQVLAARLPDGPVTALLGAPADARLEDRPEFAVSGSRVALTGRFEGEHPALAVIDLRTRQLTVLARAAAQEAFGWPSFDSDLVVFERRQRGVGLSAVRVDGADQAVPASRPASEPVLSGGWLAYKRSERFQSGPIEMVELSSGRRVLPTGLDGEDPRGAGGLFAWQTPRGDALFAYRATSSSAYRYQLTDATPAGLDADSSTIALIAKDLNAASSYSILLVEVPR